MDAYALRSGKAGIFAGDEWWSRDTSLLLREPWKRTSGGPLLLILLAPPYETLFILISFLFRPTTVFPVPSFSRPATTIMPKTQSKKNKSSSQQNNKQHKDKKPYAAPSKNKISRAGQKTRDVKLRESLDDGLMPHLQVSSFDFGACQRQI